MFSATLGSINPIDLLFDVPYWLGVQVGTESELVPRINLTSVPYSFRAHSVDSNAVKSINIQHGQVVKSFNGLTDTVRLIAGNNISITEGPGTITVNAVLPPPSTPFPTSDNLLFPSGYAEQFIAWNGEGPIVQGAPSPDVLEIPQEMALRFEGNPKLNVQGGLASSREDAFFVGFVNTPGGGPSPEVMSPCPITVVQRTTRPLPCDMLYLVKDGLVLPSLFDNSDRPKKRYIQLFTYGAGGKLVRCTDPDQRVRCPIINAVLVPAITNFVLLTFRPGTESTNRNLQLKYVVPAGNKLVINKISTEKDLRVAGSQTLPFMSINGATVDPSTLPIPYILMPGTSISLALPVRTGPGGPTAVPSNRLAMLTIQGFLRPN